MDPCWRAGETSREVWRSCTACPGSHIVSGGPEQGLRLLLRPPEGGPIPPVSLSLPDHSSACRSLGPRGGIFEEARMSAGKAVRLCGKWPHSTSSLSTCLWSEGPGWPQAAYLGCIVGAENGGLEAPWGHLSGQHGCPWEGVSPWAALDFTRGQRAKGF